MILQTREGAEVSFDVVSGVFVAVSASVCRVGHCRQTDEQRLRGSHLCHLQQVDWFARDEREHLGARHMQYNHRLL